MFAHLSKQAGWGWESERFLFKKGFYVKSLPWRLLGPPPGMSATRSVINYGMSVTRSVINYGKSVTMSVICTDFNCLGINYGYRCRYRCRL